jgi:hypothetical protein
VTANPPTRFRPGRLPLGSLENSAGSGRNKCVLSLSQFRAGLIHRLGHPVRSVAGQILLKRIAEQAAPRSLGPSREALRSFENVVWYGYRGFHTPSITALMRAEQAFGLEWLRVEIGSQLKPNRERALYMATSGPQSPRRKQRFRACSGEKVNRISGTYEIYRKFDHHRRCQNSIKTAIF